MTDIHPDVLIYLKTLRTWFLGNKNYFNDIFGKHPFEECMSRCLKVAQDNFEKGNSPNITKEQFISIRLELENNLSTIFMVFEPFPFPICLN